MAEGRIAAEYRIDLTDNVLWVSLSTEDRWLSGSIEAELMNSGDDLNELIEEGQTRGVFRADADVPAITDSLLALLSGFLYRATFDPKSANTERLTACYESLLRGALYVEEPAAAKEGRDA